MPRPSRQRRSFPRELCALDPAQYQFSTTDAPLREHWLRAHAVSDVVLQVASSKKLITNFQNAFLRRDDPESGVTKIHTIKGFQGDYWWRDAQIRFLIRGPEIPYFALNASSMCSGVPIVYSTICTETGPTPARYFYCGKEWALHDLPARVADEINQVVASGKGVVPLNALELFIQELE